jgi:LAO/AO transport system kinase
MMPVRKTEAVRDGGIAELIEEIKAHQKYLTQSGKRKAKTVDFLKNEVADILSERLSQTIKKAFETQSGKELLQELLDRKLDPYRAADLISH